MSQRLPQWPQVYWHYYYAAHLEEHSKTDQLTMTAIKCTATHANGDDLLNRSDRPSRGFWMTVHCDLMIDICPDPIGGLAGEFRHPLIVRIVGQRCDDDAQRLF